MDTILNRLAEQAERLNTRQGDRAGFAVQYGADEALGLRSSHDPTAAPSNIEADPPPLQVTPETIQRYQFDHRGRLGYGLVVPFVDQDKSYVRVDFADDTAPGQTALRPFDADDPSLSIPPEMQGRPSHVADHTLVFPDDAPDPIEVVGFDFFALRDILYFNDHLVAVEQGETLEYLCRPAFIDMDEYHAYAAPEEDDGGPFAVLPTGLPQEERRLHRQFDVEPEIMQQLPSDFEAVRDDEGREDEHVDPSILPTIDELAPFFTDRPDRFVLGLGGADEPVIMEAPVRPDDVFRMPCIGIEQTPALLGLVNLLAAQALAKGITVTNLGPEQLLPHCAGERPNLQSTVPDERGEPLLVISDVAHPALHDPANVGVRLGPGVQLDGGQGEYEMRIEPSIRSSAFEYRCPNPNTGVVRMEEQAGILRPPMVQSRRV